MEERYEAPQDDVGIWRYMSVARFLALVGKSELYFAKLHELRILDDPWEGVWTKPCAAQAFSGPYGEFNSQKISEFNQRALISCWHENEGESTAMWKLYAPGGEGVAVKTTVGKLGCELRERFPTLGRVRYEGNDYRARPDDYEGISYPKWFLFRKTPAYEHEREIRVVLFENGLQADAALLDTLWSTNRSQGTVEHGHGVPINLTKVIQRIVVSPEFPKWAIESLQKVVDSAEIHIKIQESSLLDPPSVDLPGSN